MRRLVLHRLVFWDRHSHEPFTTGTDVPGQASLLRSTSCAIESTFPRGGMLLQWDGRHVMTVGSALSESLCRYAPPNLHGDALLQRLPYVVTSRLNSAFASVQCPADLPTSTQKQGLAQKTSERHHSSIYCSADLYADGSAAAGFQCACAGPVGIRGVLGTIWLASTTSDRTRIKPAQPILGNRCF